MPLLHSRHVAPSVRAAAAGLLALLALAAPATIARAQSDVTGTVRSQHGAWAVVCDQPPGASSEQCVLLQRVVDEARPEIDLSVVAFKTADGKARILRVRAPLGVILSPPQGGLGLFVDGKKFGSINFLRCYSDGCYAETSLDMIADNQRSVSLLDVLSNGKSAVFSIFQTPEAGIGVDVDLTGFKDGFAALP